MCTRGLLPPLIDGFSSSQREVKPLVVLENGIPGQTGCLYGDGRVRGGWRILLFLDVDYMWEMDME